MSKVLITETIAYNIHRLRFISGMTQKELGDKVGVSLLTISRIETLRIKSINTAILEKIARALDTNINFITLPPKVKDVPPPKFVRNTLSDASSSINIYCRICGTKLYTDSNFCHKCGTKILP